MMQQALKSRKPFWQFRLRTVLIGLLVPCAGLSWLASLRYRVHHQRAAVSRVEQLGGYVRYGYLENGLSEPPGPSLLRWAFGDDVFSHVTTVQFGHRPISDEELVVLKELPHVKTLSGRFSIDGLIAVAGPVRLRELTVHGASARSAAKLAESQVTSDLETLTLIGAEIDDAALNGLCDLKKLESIALMSTTVTDSGLQEVAICQNLRSIAIFDCRTVTDHGLEHLQGLDLSELRLSGIAITEQGLQGALRALPRLESLELSWQPLTTETLELIGGLGEMQRLSLRQCQVKDEGMAFVGNLQNLRHLELIEPQITDDGVDHLAGLHNLELLQLITPRTTDASMNVLQKLSSLESLQVGPGISHDRALKLARSRPDLWLTYVDAQGAITLLTVD